MYFFRPVGGKSRYIMSKGKNFLSTSSGSSSNSGSGVQSPTFLPTETVFSKESEFREGESKQENLDRIHANYKAAEKKGDRLGVALGRNDAKINHGEDNGHRIARRESYNAVHNQEYEEGITNKEQRDAAKAAEKLDPRW